MAIVAGDAIGVVSGVPVLGTPNAGVFSKLANYGVKYQLYYGTVEGKKWRLDIAKDSYVGSVVPIIGQGDPVVIEWDGGDDLNSPIIGSVCYLNLFQTDDYDLSEFYTPDEYEFYVTVNHYNGSTYDLFWKGFIAQDEYTEVIQDTPFAVNVKAFDKIAFTSNEPFSRVNVTVDSEISPHEIIVECIRESGLEFDYVDCTNMKTESRSLFSTSSILLDHKLWSNNLLVDGRSSEFISYKEALEFVCRSYNARIFQYNGVLYFVSLQAYNGVSSTIQSHEYTYLSGAWSFNALSLLDVSIPDDIIVLDQSLTRTSTPAIKRYERTYNVSPKNLFYNGFFALDGTGWTTNGGDTIETDNAQRGENSISFDATNVSDGTFNGASEADKNTTYRLLQTETVNTNALTDFDHVFFDPDNTGASSEFVWLNGVVSFWYYIDETAEETYTLRFSMERNSSPNYYYDFDTGYLNKSVAYTYSDTDTTQTQRWIKLSYPLRLEVPATGVGLTFRIHSPNATGGAGTTKIYFDDLRLELTPYKTTSNKWSIDNSTAKYVVSKDSNTNSEILEEECRWGVTDVEVIENASFSEYDLNNKTLGQYYYNNAMEKVDFASAPSYTSQNLETWCLYSMCAIYSAPAQRYEGIFSDRRIATTIPFGLINYFSLDYNNYSPSDKLVLTRLSHSTKMNMFDCQFMTVAAIPSSGSLDFTVVRTYE